MHRPHDIKSSLGLEKKKIAIVNSSKLINYLLNKLIIHKKHLPNPLAETVPQDLAQNSPKVQAQIAPQDLAHP
jgi:hypothetical protein